MLWANPFLEAVPDEQLHWLITNGECLEHPAEVILYKPEDPTDHFFVLLQGRIRIYIVQGGEQ